MVDSVVSFPNRELVVYVLYLLGGDTNRVHTEELAIKCHELFPDSFSWTRYPQYPDKDIVRVALTDARKPKYGGLVEGRAGQNRGLASKTNREPVGDGWQLTTAGIAWVKHHESSLGKHIGTREVKEHRQKLLKQLSRIRKHKLFARFAEDSALFSPMIGEVADLLKCRVDAEQEVWDARFKKVQSQAESAEQEDVQEFISRCREAVSEQL